MKKIFIILILLNSIGIKFANAQFSVSIISSGLFYSTPTPFQYQTTSIGFNHFLTKTGDYWYLSWFGGGLPGGITHRVYSCSNTPPCSALWQKNGAAGYPWVAGGAYETINISSTSTAPVYTCSTEPTSWLMGGNTALACDFIGTLNPESFKIKTNNIERARITASGEMGIGTTTPTAQLEVTSVPTAVQAGIKAKGINLGVYGEATDMNAGLTNEGILAGWTEAIGVFGKGTYATNLGNGNILGVVGSAGGANPLNNIGVYGEAKNASGYNTGVYGSVVSDNATGIYNTGVGGRVYQNNTAAWNRAVSGQAPVVAKHFAGYFDGNMSVMSGNSGFNTETPRHKLQVHDGALMLSGNVAGFGGPQLLFSDDTTTHPNGKWAIEYIKPIASGTNSRPSMGGLNFWKPWNAANVPGHAYNYTLFLKDDGKIGMGVSDDTDPGNASLFCANALPNGYRLYVNGGILTTKVKIANYCSTAWADYVFAKDYKLKSLSEVEAYVKENKHLPNIPSANDIEKEGLDLADMQSLQMAKIEELTLYMIEMKKEIDALKKQNVSLQGKVSKN